MNRAKAIKAKCLECSGDSPKEVTLCHVFDCPLWPFRTGASMKSNVYKKRITTAKKNYKEDFNNLVEMGIEIRHFDAP